MTLVIHDLKEGVIDFGNSKVVSDNGSIKHCAGCFGCWTKTPGQCVIHDGYENMGRLLSECGRLVIISKCTFGGYSPFVKNVLDRSIGYVHPFFEMRNGEMHHKRRYDNKIAIELYMYGDMTDAERETAKELVRANAMNFDATVEKVCFADKAEDFKGVISFDDIN